MVVSKRAAADWALKHLPSHWAAAIRAAGSFYDGVLLDQGIEVMRSLLTEIVAVTHERLEQENSAEPAG